MTPRNPTASTGDDDARMDAFLETFAAFMDSANQRAQQQQQSTGPALAEVLAEHLGKRAVGLPVLTETVSTLRSLDADIAIERLAEADESARLLGIGGGEQRLHNAFSELVEQSESWKQFPVGAVDYTRAPTGPGTERRAVGFGLRLFTFEGAPVALLQRMASPRHGMAGAIEVMCADEDVALRLLAQIRADMIEHSILRGQVITFTASDYGPTAGGVTFTERVRVPAADVVLPPNTLERVERQVIGVARHRQALLDAGQHLKRGVLLYGPPGTGKTHTVRHLVGECPQATVILLAGSTLQLVGLAADTARALQPAVIVLEDCDLIAEDRSFHDGPQPLLFEVLDAMDGLAPDADVAFLLTTNRADLLEQALAQRPGRVDLAVEIPLPDLPARRRLFELYRAGLPFTAVALDSAAEHTEGVTASFVKEAIRRAVLRAVEAGHPVGDDDLAEAVSELTDDAEGITRSLLGGSPVTFLAEDGFEGGEFDDRDVVRRGEFSTFRITRDEP